MLSSFFSVAAVAVVRSRLRFVLTAGGGGGGGGGFVTGSGIIGKDTYTVKVGAGGAAGCRRNRMQRQKRHALHHLSVRQTAAVWWQASFTGNGSGRFRWWLQVRDSRHLNPAGGASGISGEGNAGGNSALRHINGCGGGGGAVRHKRNRHGQLTGGNAAVRRSQHK
jgi:hypothetical protein